MTKEEFITRLPGQSNIGKSINVIHDINKQKIKNTLSSTIDVEKNLTKFNVYSKILGKLGI